MSKADTLLYELAYAVRQFRNEPLLRRLNGLRGTPGYIRMVDAWDAAQEHIDATRKPKREKVYAYNPIWELAPDEIAKECEALFQAGGGWHVYVKDATGSLLPSWKNAVTTAWTADPGALVYTRRKVRGQTLYAWYVRKVTA